MSLVNFSTWNLCMICIIQIQGRKQLGHLNPDKNNPFLKIHSTKSVAHDRWRKHTMELIPTCDSYIRSDLGRFGCGCWNTYLSCDIKQKFLTENLILQLGNSQKASKCIIQIEPQIQATQTTSIPLVEDHSKCHYMEFLLELALKILSKQELNPWSQMEYPYESV